MLTDLISKLLPPTVDLRHRLHQIPELMFEEYKTAEFIRAELHRLDLEFVAGVDNAPTATIAWIGDPTKPCIALRADIDALPIVEENRFALRQHASRAHACLRT